MLRGVVYGKSCDQKVLEYVRKTVVEDERPLTLPGNTWPDTKSAYPICDSRSHNKERQARGGHRNQIHRGLNTYWQRDRP